MTLSTSTLTLIAVAAVLVVVVVGIFLLILRRLHARRDRILSELAAKPALVQDRAFNRLAMARREAEVLARTGTDLSRAQELIAQSQAAFDLRQYPRAYELAQSAHEALVNARGSTVRRAPPSAPSSWAVGTPSPDPSPTSAADSSPPPAKLPKNRAESLFELHLLEQEVQTARASAPVRGSTLEAVNLQGQAQSAFDRAEYTEAFRLALRARRSLGGSVETLSAPRRGPAAPRPSRTPAPPVDPVAAAERAAAASRCPSCGYPTLPDDTFCRGCGEPRTASACPTCGANRSATDTFCGRCGVAFAA
jgi:hypothetical protein